MLFCYDILLNIRGTSPDTISGKASRSESMVPILSLRKLDTPVSSSAVVAVASAVVVVVVASAVVAAVFSFAETSRSIFSVLSSFSPIGDEATPLTVKSLPVFCNEEEPKGLTGDDDDKDDAPSSSVT